MSNLAERIKAEVKANRIKKSIERDKRHKLIEELSKEDKARKIIEYVLDCKEEITREQYADCIDFEGIESMLDDILKAAEGL